MPICMSCQGKSEGIQWFVGKRQSPESRGDHGNASVLGRFIAVIIIGTITSLRLPGGRNWVCQPISFHQNRSFTPNVYQAGMCLTKQTSALRHSFTATLVEPAVNHRMPLV